MNAQPSPQPAHLSLIFVVDDEWVVARTVALILRHQGFTVESFISPMEALQQAKTHRPDLLISDVIMPGLSGPDLAVQILRQHPGCKVVLCSGQAGTAHLLEQARFEGFDFTLLQKPVPPTDLIRIVEDLAA